MKLKCYCPEDLWDKGERGFWFELIKSKERLERSAKPADQIIQSFIEWTVLEEAELWVLPMHWNYYYQEGRVEEAMQFCKQAKSLGKIVWSYTGGDYGITVPVPHNVMIYRATGYKRRLKPQEKIAPVFINDPISIYFQNNLAQIIHRPLSSPPTIGFCGMAPSDAWTRLREPTKTWIRNVAGRLGLHPYDPQAVMSTSALRYRILQRLQHSEHFSTHFIIRQKYRAGASTAAARKRTTLEYYNNQLESDLNVCVRGGGNFSVRFYETLAMGRIPLFCDTDSPLPEIDGDWNEHIIRFTPQDIPILPDLILKWLHGKDLHEVFRRNRQLWEEQLSLQGFWPKELKQLSRDF